MNLSWDDYNREFANGNRIQPELKSAPTNFATPLDAVQGSYPPNTDIDNAIINAYNNSATKKYFLDNAPLGFNKYVVATKLYNDNGTKKIFEGGGGDAQKKNKQKEKKDKQKEEKDKQKKVNRIIFKQDSKIMLIPSINMQPHIESHQT